MTSVPRARAAVDATRTSTSSAQPATTGKVLVDPGATLGLVQLMDPVVVQLHPAGTGVSETNVVFAGNDSMKVPAAQLLGPLLVTTWV